MADYITRHGSFRVHFRARKWTHRKEKLDSFSAEQIFFDVDGVLKQHLTHPLVSF